VSLTSPLSLDRPKHTTKVHDSMLIYSCQLSHHTSKFVKFIHSFFIEISSQICKNYLVQLTDNKALFSVACVCNFLTFYQVNYEKTSISTVAEKPHDASCLSVASIVRYVECKFRFRFTAAYNSLLFEVVVHACCNKRRFIDVRRSVWQTAWWTVAAVDCTAAVIDPIARYSLRITIFAYPTCI